MNFGRRLEPPARRVLHGAGQSPDEFRKYWDAVSQTPPAIYMSYCGLKRYTLDFYARLRHELDSYEPHCVIPQIGLAMTHDGKPEGHYEHEVAAGRYDAQLDGFWEGLSGLRRPVFLRIGYEFNGHWNGYEPEPFKAAWRRVGKALRDHKLDEVATVWCYAPEGNNREYQAYYPGHDVVDWWAVDLFGIEQFDSERTRSFMEEAARRGFPVMIGESTPRRVGVLEGARSWEKWFARYFRFIREHPHVKAFCYISWDWGKYPKWQDWGECRIHVNGEVLERYRRELADGLYIHAQAEGPLRRAVGLA